MHVFVTGATGWVGSVAVPALSDAGHEVTGLARSDAAAAALDEQGVAVRRGELEDLDSLRAGAHEADAVLHLAFHHDFENFAAAGRIERAAVDAMLDELAKTGKRFLLASGLAIPAHDGEVTEETPSPDVGADAARGGSEVLALESVERGVHPVALRFAPTVHGADDPNFVTYLAHVARERGVAGYVDDGASRWPAVHRSDLAHLITLALASAPAGSVVHGAAEQGIPTRRIAELLGEALGVPARSVPQDEAPTHFGWIAPFWGADLAASSRITRELLDWTPTGPSLEDDIRAGHYTPQAARV